MSEISDTERWLSASLAHFTKTGHQVALIGFPPVSREPGAGLVEVRSAPRDALAALQAVPARAGDRLRQFQLAVWNAGAVTDRASHSAGPGDRDALALLAWLRDVGADETWVMVAFGRSGWAARLQALGFTEPTVGQTGDDTPRQPPCRCFRFAIRSYKQAPDWLNARDWANPELFGLFRW